MNNELWFNKPPGGAGGYAIERSLRFNSADSAYLSRTPGSAGNRKTWTWAGWVKRSSLGSRHMIFGNLDSGATIGFMIEFNAANTLDLYDYGSGYLARRDTTQVFRDCSAWYHIVIAYDSTNATGADRLRVYINGNRVTSFNTSTDPTLNADGQFNTAVATSIGRSGAYTSLYFNGYLADIHFIDGQALDPTSFGEFDDNGIWQPIAYSGSYGTNGFHLDFADNSSAAALGYDAAGSNDWTVNNISVAAGAGNDSLVDVPTNGSEVDTGLGAQVRGNYCTLNPLDNSGNLSNGNLDFAWQSASERFVGGTIAIPSSGKWFYEVTVNSGLIYVGLAVSSGTGAAPTTVVSYRGQTGDKNIDTAQSAYGATYTNGDVIGVAVNADTNQVTFYKNGASQGAISYTLTGKTLVPYLTVYNGSVTANFGQRPFAYTAPSGFKALCTANLPAPVVTKPSTVMDVLTWTGTGGGRTLSGLGFSPDLVWGKSRSDAYNHQLYDVIRGAGNANDLSSSLTAAEGSATVAASQYGYLSAFTSDGFTVANGTDGSLPNAYWNASSKTYVAWCWDAGSSTVTNTQGSITSSVRANASAGFSVIIWTGGSAGTVGHGLGVTPAFVITKSRTNGVSWRIWHRSFASLANYLGFDSGSVGTFGSGNYWQTPTSTTIGFTGGYDNNVGNMVAYCFAPVAGYSAFGSYTGNGSTDGPFVYTGFRPRWVMIKNSSANSASAYGSWKIIDTARDTYNGGNPASLYANAAYAEGKRGNGDPDTYTERLDLLSNGFKLGAATSYDIETNESGVTYIYAAFAEHPFQYARAR